MNYKISTYVLSALLGILIITLIYEDQEVSLTQERQKQFISDVVAQGDTAGQLIHPEKAKRALDRFAKKKKRDIFYKWKNHSYGYFFGLKKWDAFRDTIKYFNKKLPEGEKIMGVRVYKSITVKEDDEYYDVFIIPVTENGHNFPEIDEHQQMPIDYADGSVALNASIPCPNNCGGQ